MDTIIKRLYELADADYRAFHAPLIPTVDAERILGVRVPLLRKLARELANTREGDKFIATLPHFYYDENNLHAFIIERERSFEECILKTEAFLPYIDNWATCDMLSPKVFGRNKPALLQKIKEWLCSKHTYTARFATVMLMRHYLGDEFTEDMPQLVLAVESNDYYIKMAKAWYFATALSYRYEDILPYLKTGISDIWIHNKSIQKAIESYRISPEQKAELRALKTTR